MTRKELARYLNVCVTAVSNWENNLRMPRLAEFIKLVSMLELTPIIFGNKKENMTQTAKQQQIASLQKQLDILRKKIQEISAE